MLSGHIGKLRSKYLSFYPPVLIKKAYFSGEQQNAGKSCLLDIIPIGFLNSWQPWFPVENRACKHSSTDRGEAHEAPVLLEEPWLLVAAGAEKLIFPHWCSH